MASTAVAKHSRMYVLGGQETRGPLATLGAGRRGEVGGKDKSDRTSFVKRAEFELCMCVGLAHASVSF